MSTVPESVQDDIRVFFDCGERPGEEGRIFGDGTDAHVHYGGYLQVSLNGRVLLERFGMEAHLLMRHPRALRELAFRALQ